MYNGAGLLLDKVTPARPFSALSWQTYGLIWFIWWVERKKTQTSANERSSRLKNMNVEVMSGRILAGFFCDKHLKQGWGGNRSREEMYALARLSHK